MFSRWRVTNITSARGTLHFRKSRIPCGDQLVISGLYLLDSLVEVAPYALSLRSEDAFVITCVANLMEVKVLFVQQDLRYEISIYSLFSV
jgi:hypothetical protein